MISELKTSGHLGRLRRWRPVAYLNNIVEQDQLAAHLALGEIEMRFSTAEATTHFEALEKDARSKRFGRQ